MEKITKKDFMELHENKKMKLIQGMIKKPKEEILTVLENTPDIENYLKPLSRYGNLTSDKTGRQTVNIYQHGPFIFVEDTIDNSKNPNCSWNDLEVYNTIYFLTE